MCTVHDARARAAAAAAVSCSSFYPLYFLSPPSLFFLFNIGMHLVCLLSFLKYPSNSLAVSDQVQVRTYIGIQLVFSLTRALIPILDIDKLLIANLLRASNTLRPMNTWPKIISLPTNNTQCECVKTAGQDFEFEMLLLASQLATQATFRKYLFPV